MKMFVWERFSRLLSCLLSRMSTRRTKLEQERRILSQELHLMWVLLVVKLMIYFSQKLDETTGYQKMWVLVWIQSIRLDCSCKWTLLLFVKITTKWENTDRLLLLFLILGSFKSLLLPILVCLVVLVMHREGSVYVSKYTYRLMDLLMSLWKLHRPLFHSFLKFF